MDDDHNLVCMTRWKFKCTVYSVALRISKWNHGTGREWHVRSWDGSFPVCSQMKTSSVIIAHSLYISDEQANQRKRVAVWSLTEMN